MTNDPFFGNSPLHGIPDPNFTTIPNSPPIGIPLITGRLIPGEFISIDPSRIDDPDNIGETPLYEYAFLISHDQGQSWNPIGERTDGHEDIYLKVTTSMLGKLIRGIVSYWDFHGNPEYIYTDSQRIGPVVRGNSLYTIVDGPSWTQAEENAVKLGGNLVTIDNAQENAFLLTGYERAIKTLGGDGFYWLGMQDSDDDGTYSWSSSESSDFTSWFDGEPSGGDVYGPENYGFTINFLDDDQSEWQNGYWYDTTLDGNGQIPRGIAETPFIRRGDSAYVIVQGPTWEEAEANAVALGGHLVTINDAEENQWIIGNYSTSIHQSLYIGLHKSPDDNWIWTDASEEGSYINWTAGAPSPGPTSAEIILKDLGWAHDANPVGFHNNAPSPSPYASWGLAEIKLAPNNNPTGTPILLGDFKAGQVITIDKTTIQDADNFEGWAPTYKYSWEVADDPGLTQVMPVWEALNTADATDGDENLEITDDLTGKLIRGAVGYMDGYGTNESVHSDASIAITKEHAIPVVRGNSLYTIVDGPFWTQAEAKSVKLGGNLVTINDAEENAFLLTGSERAIKTLGGDGFYWLGMQDSDDDGVYAWSSEQSSDFTSWFDGEPSGGDVYGPENYGFTINFLDDDQSEWQNGYWYDTTLDGNGQIPRGIAETPFIRRGDSAYVIVQGPTWEEAEANAVKLGGHLVTISDAEENSWILSAFKNNNYNAYIGYSDKNTEGTWIWSSGEQGSYANWNTVSSEPNNSRYPDGVDEDYALIHLWQGGPLGTWNDGREYGVNFGIAEIKLAPNNTPTGTPALSGTLKAGQVITIDRNPIQDADNFTGYTPDFKYSWEIANDPGMTMMIPVWESLNTADATDGDETFTVTADLTGKLIRGVVSYLDGYGTQESIASTASAPITSSAPPVQSLTLTAPSKSAIRSGTNSTSAISYTVSTGETSLTGVGASLYFDSTQLTVSTSGEPFQKGLIGNAIVPDTNNADGDPKTDKVLALTYADFGGNFPGSGTTLPLTLANLNLVPTSSYSGTTLHLKGSPATGFTATGADLTLGYNASPVVNSTLPALTTNRGSAFSYTFRSDLFTDPDSTLTLSATTSTGTALPSWLSFNPATRTLSGTPTAGGTLNLNLSASDELGSVSTPLSIKVQEVQQLSSSASTIRYQRNKDFTLPINYSTTDGSSSTGLAFKVHFNSSLFSFDPINGVSNKLASAGLFEVGAVQQDTDNSDNDPTTDQYIPISIASFTGQLPSGSKLADLTFRTADKAIDPLTGLKDTSINFSETSVASGYGFSGTSASLKPLSFNLDVDGDGLVTPLGDGLMVIRYLFGNAFAGDALINKAISPDSPLLGGKSYSEMTATERAGVASLVATNIQQGIDSGLLDVDKDGKTTPLGDGLMVIRRLFGNAFAGSALTSKAISPESPYFSDPNAHLIVASNIDDLKPTPSVI